MTEPTIVDGVLYGMDAQVAAWVQSRLKGCTGFGLSSALGIVRDGAIVGGVVFSNWHPGARDIEVSGAVGPGFRVGPAGVRRIMRYAFVQLGCGRVSIRTGKRNKAARAFAERIGFRIEGVRRAAHDGRQDQILYGLLASECRFLRKDR